MNLLNPHESHPLLAMPGPEEMQFLREAAEYLERPSFLIRVANLVGKPAETILQLLPNVAQKTIVDASDAALWRALDWSVRSLPKDPSVVEAPKPIASVTSTLTSRFERGRRLVDHHMHTAAAATTGAVGGLFGVAGLPVELPATTMIMLRSIARIARQEGADLSDPATRLQCLTVFSMGSSPLETMESAYLTSRLGMAFAVKDATAYFAKHSAIEISQALSHGSAPALVRLINVIASRFQVVITEKVAAQAVPVAGAAMGALINAAFTDHFNRVARYHFGIVRLEQQYGRENVQHLYALASETQRKLRQK